jgi:TolB protein
MNPDGSEVKRLTHVASSIEAGRREAKYARRPCWSPHGQKIAFGSNFDGNDEIYVMARDGSNVTRLTHTPATEYYSSWSPDGRKIAFSSNRDQEHDYQIFVMDADGSNPVRITAK